MLKSEFSAALASTSLGQFLDDPKEIDLIYRHSKLVSFSAGEVIIAQGKKAKGMYVIIEGTALITAKILGEGGTYITSLGKGNLVGEMSLIDDEPSATSVIASSRLQCLLISPLFYDMLSVFFPHIKFKITKSIASEVYGRFREISDKIGNFMHQNDMGGRSIFGEVIKSFTHPVAITFDEAHINIAKLRYLNLFKSFSDEEFKILMRTATVIKAPNHCLLIQEYEEHAPCYLLLKGAVQSSIVHQKKMLKLAALGPVTFFGSLALIDEKTTSIINYTSCERAILLKFTHEELKEFQAHNIELWYKIFEWVCKSLVSLERSADKLDIRLNIELYNR